MRWVVQSLFALLAIQSANAAGLQLRQSGVNLEVFTMPDRVVLCFNADDRTKISGQYGVSIESPADAGTWQDRLPERIASEDWDFKLPLRVDMRTKREATGQKLRLKLGACSDQCNLVTFDAFARLFRDGLNCQNALFLDGSVSSLYAPELNRDDEMGPIGPIAGVVGNRQ